MNWITDYVKPRIQSFVSKKDMPDNLWVKCKQCSQMIFHRDFHNNLNVCTNCQYHHHISPSDRFNGLFDRSEWDIVSYPESSNDPLKFKDTKRYPDRLKEARSKTDDQESIKVGYGKIGKNKAVAAAHNFQFMGGSMGIAVGNALIAAAQRAVQEKAALIVFPSAGGARMQEGILSLMQMPRTTIAADMMRDAKLPFIVVLTNPTTGGVTASYAMLGDVHIAEPDALICFTGPRVIEQTIKEKLPEGFQRSEYLKDHGMVDMIIPRNDQSYEIGRMLKIMMANI
ncbi:MAG: acetyl-CoA carboxylase carboxyl transferase subunit beta [Alphaproteobacteria bacterium]|jgi:acetyl-CoA carboxylase carboxyl transferase subunit beta